VRNVDVGTFLERRDIGKDLVLRPKKESVFQYWSFEKSTSDDKLWVIKAAPGPRVSTASLQKVISVNPSSNATTFDKENSRNIYEWQFCGGEDYKLIGKRTYILVETAKGAPLLLNADAAVNGIALDSAGLNETERLTRNIQDDNYKWELLEVDDPQLPNGDNQNYRIRTLTGQALEIHEDESNGKKTYKVKLQTQDQGDKHRHWTLEPSPGNGQYTLKNVETKKYLGTKDQGSLKWVVSAEDTPSVWQVSATSDFTFAISALRPIMVDEAPKPQPLSLSIDKGNAILKPKKPAHNQFWLLEPEDAHLHEDEEDGEDEDNNNTGPTGPKGSIIKGLLAGNYRLKSKIPSSLCVGLVRNPAFGTFSAQSVAESSASKFTVEKSTKGVVLYFKLSMLKVYLAVSNGAIVGQPNVEYVWKVEQGSQGKQYFIIDNSSNLVFTSPSIVGAAFSLTGRDESTTKLWDLVVAA